MDEAKKKLLRKLREAKRGHRDLDWQIVDALDPEGNWQGAPAFYTTSLDGARSLIPEGFFWGVSTQPEDDGPAMATLTKYKPDREGEAWDYHEHATAATPELALCIAALKARWA